MAINLTEKYEKKVAERFSASSLTDAHAGKDYEFSGVKTIKIFSIDTVPMTDYTRSGTSRYGELVELGDTVQEMTLTKDRSFTFSIDAGNAAQQFNVKQANAALKRQVDEVVTPEVDAYRFAKWADGAGLNGTATITKANAIETIFNAGAAMSNAKVPMKGRTLFIKQSAYIHAKLAEQVVGVDKLGEKAIANGVVGMLDGMDVVPVPDSYFPETVNFIIKYKGATVDPIQLKDYQIHKRPMGVDGDVVEGRIIYDAFVIESKKNGIFVSKNA